MTHTGPQTQTSVRLPKRLVPVLIAAAAALPAVVAGTGSAASAATTSSASSAGTAGGTGAATVTAAAQKPGQCMSVALTQRFANGMIPVAALCPVAGSTELLRTDAATSFNRMSSAYRARFGSRICVSDGYRTLDAQKKLFKVKPKLAAKPGTSNHGWGTAVDLCGGVERYSTKKHRWLKENAATYGWSNPYWARKGGGREEPWHWEFTDGTVASRLR